MAIEQLLIYNKSSILAILSVQDLTASLKYLLLTAYLPCCTPPPPFLQKIFNYCNHVQTCNWT